MNMIAKPVKRVIIIFAFSLLIANTLWGQIFGTISGQVTDKADGEALPAVNLLLSGTVLGGATDVDGNYTLNRIPPGTYQLVVSMMGYKRIEFKNVTVNADKTTVLNFQMEETVIETPEVLVTANKRRQSIQDSPNSVGVMTARELKEKNQIYIDKLLEYSSGINYIGSQVNIRGSSGFSYGAGSRVLFLIDGVPVMPGDSGDIKWDMVPATQVEQVEIIKGAGSALYGANALGGVINIITKKTTPKPTTNIRMSAGLYDKPRFEEWRWAGDRTLHFDDVNIDHSRRIKNADVMLSLGRQQTTGYRQNGNYQRLNGSAKIFTKINGQQNLTLSANAEGGESGAGLMWRDQRHALEVAPEAIGDYYNSNKFGLNGFHNWIAGKNFGLKTRLSWFRNYWKNYFHDNDNASTANRYGFEMQGDYQVSEENSITFGTEESWDHVVSGLVGTHDQYSVSLYAQNERKLITNVMLTLGLRYDYQYVDIGFNDSELSPKLGVVWHAQSDMTFRLSSGRGFRAASMSERFSDSIFSGIRIIPNQNLKSETAWSHELGCNYNPNPHFYLDIAGFWNDYWDLIEPEPDETQTVQFTNVTRARIKGVETNLKVIPWFNNAAIEVGYTFMDPEDLDLNTVLAYRAKHLLKSSVSYQIGKLQIGADYIYVSRLDKVKVYPNDDRVAQKTLNGRLALKFLNYTLMANVNNALNHNHTQMERTLLPIRNYVLSLSTTF
ncbi:MAG TPA: TonB-dependent receptor [bacterium]|nr:TonB-dependent receptor [bacterium]HPN42441.1 TonB-dependent receptor [bacterium]